MLKQCWGQTEGSLQCWIKKMVGQSFAVSVVIAGEFKEVPALARPN